VFKLAKLAQLYTERLTQLGIVLTSRLNTTRLKIGCCHIFPICVLTAQQCGKHVLLVFDEHIGETLSAACQQSCDEDSQHLAKAAEILRRDIFDKSYKF